MDYRSFISRLSKATQNDSKDTARLASSVVAIIAQSAAETDSIAMPGFGTFEAVKTLEYVSTDPATGRKTLVPPSISVVFKPGSRLKKAVAKL